MYLHERLSWGTSPEVSVGQNQLFKYLPFWSASIPQKAFRRATQPAEHFR